MLIYVLPVQFNIINTPLTGSTTINGNIITILYAPYILVTNAIVVNGGITGVPLPSSAIVVPLYTVLARFNISNIPLTGTTTIHTNTITALSALYTLPTNAIL